MNLKLLAYELGLGALGEILVACRYYMFYHVAGDRHPAAEQVVLPLGGQGGGATDHRGAGHGGGPYARLLGGQHARGPDGQVHSRAHPPRALRPIRRVHGAAPAQVMEPRRRHRADPRARGARQFTRAYADRRGEVVAAAAAGRERRPVYLGAAPPWW